MVLKITVKTLDSQNYQFEANDDWNVKQFKEHIEPTIQVPSNEQRLIFCGRVLQDDNKLTEYDCNGKVIHLVRRPPPSSDGPNPSTADSNNNNSNFPDNGNGNNRFLDESNVLFSAMTLGPENENMNHILRHMLSLQQAIIGRTDGTAAVTTMEPASMTDMERHLHNATRLLRITVNTINECMARIAALPPVRGQRTTLDRAQSSLSSPRTVITATSSHTNLQQNETMNTDETINQETTSRRVASGTTVDDMGVGGPAGISSPFFSRPQPVLVPRQSLTTDDLPPTNTSSTPRGMPLLGPNADNQYSHVPNAQQRGEADLDRYLSILNYSCDLQNQFQGLLRRYRQLTDMSRRGGLIVPQQALASTNDSSVANPPSISSSSSSSPASNAEPSLPTDQNDQSEIESRPVNDNRPSRPQARGLSSTLMEEAMILGVYVPRIMHHISHLQHALSDFSVDFANGRLDEVEGRRRQTARRSSRPRYATPRELSRSRASARHSTSTNRAQSASRTTANRGTTPSGRGPSIERSVTITATTVEATPVVTASTSSSNMAQTNATFVVTADPRQAGIRIPVPIPLPIGSLGSITMDFTPTVSTRSRTQSLREPEGRGTESGASNQESNRRSGTNQQQQTNTTRSQQATTSNSTQTANRPFGVISGRIPIPFDYFLPCFSPWATYSVANRTVRPNEMQPTRITLRTPHTQASAPQATTNTAPFAGASPQASRNVPVSDGGLSEVVSNIVGAFFRPQQIATAQQGTNSSSNNSQDPLLNMLPGIAINAATQILGGVFGVPQTAGQQQDPPQQATTGHPATTLNNSSVMMDIDIDDSSSSQSESRYHDANETQPATAAASSGPNQLAGPQRPSLVRQNPWVSPTSGQSVPEHSQSSSNAHTTIQQPIPAANTRHEHRQLVEVMRNHPDWIPIIEADISVMEQSQQNVTNNQPFFSDAYLSSIPRKRRRLLTATPERVLILQPSPSQAISNLLRRSIMNSNSTDTDSLEQVLSSISSDPELQAAYDEHIKTAVEVRLRSDYDYCPEKFEHSNKYFK